MSNQYDIIAKILCLDCTKEPYDSQMQFLIQVCHQTPCGVLNSMSSVDLEVYSQKSNQELVGL